MKVYNGQLDAVHNCIYFTFVCTFHDTFLFFKINVCWNSFYRKKSYKSWRLVKKVTDTKKFEFICYKRNLSLHDMLVCNCDMSVFY